MEVVDLFKHSPNKKTFKEGQILFNEGEMGDVMYVILEGEVEIVAMRHVFEVAGPGSIVGEMALIDPGPRTAAVRAKTNCVVVPIDTKEFLFMVQKMPDFSLRVMSLLVKRLRMMDARFN